MIEFCLLIFYFYTVYFHRRKITPQTNCTFTPDSIRLKDFEENVQEAETKYLNTAMKAYTKIMEKVQGKTVVQIQMFGLEFLDRKESSGIFQLATAKLLREKFNAELIYANSISRYPAIMEYFKQKNISYFIEEEFSIDRFHETILKANVENPVILCYFSKLSYAYFSFCNIHWDPEIAKHLVFVTNDNSPPFDYNIYITEEKFKALKWCIEIPIIIRREDEFRHRSADSIKFAHVQEAVSEAQKICFHSALAVYTQIMSVLKERKVIQIQMYGLGNICCKRKNGPLQLAVALKLQEKFKIQYPDLSMTSQEPCMYPAEIEYLKSLNITVFEGKKFCSSRILNPKNGVLKPLIIVYGIHLPPEAFEGFLEAHWNAELLTQIIFVSNAKPDYPWGQKSGRYFAWCESKPIVEKCPAYCVTDEEKRNWSAFCNTQVHTISYENAKNVIY